MNKLLTNVLEDWKKTWHMNKWVFWGDAIGVGSSILASLVFNLGMPDPDLLTAIILYAIGSILLMFTSYYKKDSWLLLLMTWYTFINFVGIIKFI